MTGVRLVSVTVRVKVSVSDNAGFPLSVAVRVTGYTPASANVVVPEITPVVELIDKLAGRPVAAHVTESPSGSMNVGDSDTAADSPAPWFPTGAMTGAWLTSVTVRTKFSLPLSAGLPLSVAVTVIGYTPASVNVVVPEITPVVGLIDKLAGRPIADHVKESPCGSVAVGVAVVGLPSATVMLVSGATTGGVFWIVTTTHSETSDVSPLRFVSVADRIVPEAPLRGKISL